jgi:hypothetical protein
MQNLGQASKQLWSENKYQKRSCQEKEIAVHDEPFFRQCPQKPRADNSRDPTNDYHPKSSLQFHITTLPGQTQLGQIMAQKSDVFSHSEQQPNLTLIEKTVCLLPAFALRLKLHGFVL